MQDLLGMGVPHNKLLVLFTKTDRPESKTNEDLIDAMFPDISDASNFTFARITLNSTTYAVNVIREFIKPLPRRV